jgi:hypothetical protein
MESYRSISAADVCICVVRASSSTLQSDDGGAGAGVEDMASVGKGACGRARLKPCDGGVLRGGKGYEERKRKGNE